MHLGVRQRLSAGTYSHRKRQQIYALPPIIETDIGAIPTASAKARQCLRTAKISSKRCVVLPIDESSLLRKNEKGTIHLAG